MIEKKILDNNVVLVTEKNESSRTASLGFWFAAGSRYENKNNRGISHLTEHLLFKGTEKRSARDIALTFDRMGGFINAFTERENVCLYCVVPALNGNFKTAADCMFDMSRNCTFPEDEFEREKSVVQSEISGIEDESDESALDELARQLWADETLSSTIGGSEKDVQALTRDQVVEFYDENFVHGETVIFACGNIDEKLLEEYALSLKSHKKVLSCFNEFHFSAPAEWKSGVNFVSAKFTQSQIFLSYKLPPVLTEKEHYALCVLDAITGDTMSSRLFQTLRERNGLCYSVYSFYTFYENANLWSAYVTCERKNVPQVVRLLHDEIEGIIKNGITEEELEDAKCHICGDEIMGSSDNEYLMKRCQKNLSLNFPLRTTEEVLECIRSLEKHDIIEVIRKLFNTDGRNLLVYGPKLSSRVKKEILCLEKSE